jgi:ATP-dependent DNA helicase 2 subunit 1
LLSTGDADDEERGQLFVENGGSNGFDVNRANIRKKIYQKRRLCSTFMSLSEVEGQEIRLGVEVYKLASVTKKPYHTWLYSATNEPVKLVSKYINTATGATLDSNQIETNIDLNGVSVPMTTDDMIELKKTNNIANVGLRIAYFIPQSTLPNELNLSEPYFIFPDEKSIKGSSDLFEALLRDLHAKKLVAIVKFNRTANSPMSVAAMIPQLAVIIRINIKNCGNYSVNIVSIVVINTVYFL